jgi:hypothetical protein
MRSNLFFYPNLLKKNAKTGNIPIYLKIIHNRQKAEARLNEELSENDMLKWNPMIMRLDERSSHVNSIQNSISNRFNEFKIVIKDKYS